MEINSTDIFIEFLEVAFHYLLFINKVYPEEIFESRKKYGVSVKYSIHPEVNDYLTNCLMSIKELLNSDALDKVVFCILDPKGNESKRFTFDTLNINYNCFKNQDHYLIQCEQSLRSFFLKLANSDIFSRPPSEASSFSLLIHTNESAAVNASKKPELEQFPLIEHETSNDVAEDKYSIIPIHTIKIDLFKVQIYAEDIKSSD